MLIYSVVPPLFDSEETGVECVSDIRNGVPVFYEKDPDGRSVLKFSTDPKMYLEREVPLQ